MNNLGDRHKFVIYNIMGQEVDAVEINICKTIKKILPKLCSRISNLCSPTRFIIEPKRYKRLQENI